MPIPEPHANEPDARSQAATPIAMAGPSVDLNLTQEIEFLHRADIWRTGISRKSLVRYPDFSITLIAMKADTKIEEHDNPGRISVHTVAGHIRMHAAGKLFDLPQGRVLVLDRSVRHDVEALEESAFLLTVARPDSAPSR